MSFEVKIIKWLQTFRSGGLDWFFKITAHFTDLAGIIIFGLVLFFFYKKTTGVYFLSVQAVAAVFQRILKVIVARPRPYMAFPEIQSIYEETSMSMPSGHSVGAMGMALFLAYIVYTEFKGKTGLTVVGYISVGLILVMNAINRMYLGQHYLTDIIVGYAIMALICVAALYLAPYFKGLWAKFWKNFYEKHPKRTDNKVKQKE